MSTQRECLNCSKQFFGRSDKKFCSVKCKNDYNYEQRKGTKDITKVIDEILHRNRIILATLMGTKRTQMKVSRLELNRMGFKFDFITGTYKNSKKKIYHYVYDYAWMEFSSQEIMIVHSPKYLERFS
ncbi:MAG: hypothetical protein GY810_22310 [Aureispira sp.]|nr:hypothetical protein [Aureispira sp.]